MSEYLPPITLEVYAALLAELGRAAGERERVLARHSLTEDDWERVDLHYQTLLEEEDDEEEEGVPPAVARFSEAFTRSGTSQSPELGFEQYAEVVRLVQRGLDVSRVLEQRGISVVAYLEAHTHYVQRILAEPELRQHFERLLQGD